MENLKYEDALLKLEEIARKMESGEYDVDQLSAKLKEAQKLIKMCKEKLADADAEIQKLLE